MASQSAIKLTKLVERFELEVLNQGKNYDRCLIRADDINRPALQILGFFDYFAPDRIQVIGKSGPSCAARRTPPCSSPTSLTGSRPACPPGSPATACWWMSTERGSSSWGSPAWARVRPPWSW